MTDETRGPDGRWRKGMGRTAATPLEPGDPDNPSTCNPSIWRQHARAHKTPNAQQTLVREEMRAELVGLDVLERLLSPARQATHARLPRLPDDPRAARREAKRLAAQSLTRSLRSLERIARDPGEAPALRAEIARLLLGRANLLPDRGPGSAGDAKKEPKVIVVNRVPRPPKQPPAPPPVAPPPQPRPLSPWELAEARERAAAEDET